MKIVFIASRSLENIGGIETYMKNLCPGLVKLGYEVILYTEGNKYSVSEYKGVKIVAFKSIQSKFLNKILIALKATIHAIRYYQNADIFHYNAIPSAFFSIIPILLNKKVIYQGHGFEWQRAKWSGLSQKAIKFFEFFVIKINKNITMVSEDQSNYIRKYFNKESVTITPAITLPHKKKISSQIMRKYNLRKNEYFLFLGRLVEEKNPDLLIRAFNESKIKNKKLVIAGDDVNSPKYIAMLKEIGKGNNNIVFTGAVFGEDKETLLKNCFAFCIPSSLEGLPITLLEAMSYSKICIASDIPACKEALGENGIYLKVSSVEDITSKLIDLNENVEKYSNLKEENYNRVKNNFTWESIVKKYDNYIKQI